MCERQPRFFAVTETIGALFAQHVLCRAFQKDTANNYDYAAVD